MGRAHHARRPRANYDGFKSHVPLVAVFNPIGKRDAFYLARGGKIRYQYDNDPKTGHVRGSKRQNP